LLAVGLASTSASAFCRSRTCKDEGGYFCDREGSCIVEGHELFRSSSCTSYAIQEAGSAENGIDDAEFNEIVREAFDRWLTADCGGGERPSIDVRGLGSVACEDVDYNTNSGNVSVFVFRDDWSLLDTNAYALTTVFFETTTGEIYDADVELNATVPDLVTSDPAHGVDLGSILTHEVGHFLGLAHSEDPGAVMRPYYTPVIDNLRELREDDVAGICEIYPPGRKTSSERCAPRHGFARNCKFEPLEASGGGCTFTPSAFGARSGAAVAGASLGGLAGAALLGAGLVRFRRRRAPSRAARQR
jgi:hypothetical protein